MNVSVRDDHSTQDAAPIFLIGSGRCGSTLLRVILSQHPQLAAGTETHVLTCVARFEDHLQKPRQQDFLRHYQTEPGEYVQGLIQKYREMMQRHSLALGKPRWIDKTPAYFKILPQLARWFPDAKFIHLKQDNRREHGELKAWQRKS